MASPSPPVTRRFRFWATAKSGLLSSSPIPMGNMKHLYEAILEAQRDMGLVSPDPDLYNVEHTQRAIAALLDSINETNGIEPTVDQESLF
jgi:hypothetical protein